MISATRWSDTRISCLLESIIKPKNSMTELGVVTLLGFTLEPINVHVSSIMFKLRLHDGELDGPMVM